MVDHKPTRDARAAIKRGYDDTEVSTMKRFLVAIAAVAAIGVAAATPAVGVPTSQEDAVSFDQPNVSAIRDRVRDRLRERLHKRIATLHHRVVVLAPEPVVVTPTPSPSPTGSPTPTPTPTPSYTGGVLTDAQVANYLRAAGFPESAIPTMLFYSHRESGNDPRAINASSGACGLFQLYPCVGGSAWLDPATNARLAYEKYRASGFSPWGG